MEYKQTQIQLYSKAAQNTKLSFSNWLKSQGTFDTVYATRNIKICQNASPLFVRGLQENSPLENSALLSFMFSVCQFETEKKKNLFPNNCYLKANPSLRILLRAAEAKLNSELRHLGGNRCRGNPVVFIPHLVFRSNGNSIEPFCIVFIGVIYYPS